MSSAALFAVTLVFPFFFVPLLLLWTASRWRRTSDLYLLWSLLSFVGLVVGLTLMLTKRSQSGAGHLRQELELLQKLAELRDAGVLSESEHDARRRGVLSALSRPETNPVRAASILLSAILVPLVGAVTGLQLYLRSGEPDGRVAGAWLACNAGRGDACIASRYPNGLFPETVQRLRIRTEIFGVSVFYTADVSPFADVEIGQPWPD